MPDAVASAASGQRDVVRAAHAQLFDGLARRYAGRIPHRRMLQLYGRGLGLAAHDEAWLAGRHNGQLGGEPTGLLRFRDWLRLYGAPHGDPALRRRLDADLARCRCLIAGLEARRPRPAAPPDRLLMAACRRSRRDGVPAWSRDGLTA